MRELTLKLFFIKNFYKNTKVLTTLYKTPAKLWDWGITRPSNCYLSFT